MEDRRHRAKTEECNPLRARDRHEVSLVAEATKNAYKFVAGDANGATMAATNALKPAGGGDASDNSGDFRSPPDCVSLMRMDPARRRSERIAKRMESEKGLSCSEKEKVEADDAPEKKDVRGGTLNDGSAELMRILLDGIPWKDPHGSGSESTGVVRMKMPDSEEDADEEVGGRDDAGSLDAAGSLDEASIRDEAGSLDDAGSHDEAGIRDETDIREEAGSLDEVDNGAGADDSDEAGKDPEATDGDDAGKGDEADTGNKADPAKSHSGTDGPVSDSLDSEEREEYEAQHAADLAALDEFIAALDPLAGMPGSFSAAGPAGPIVFESPSPSTVEEPETNEIKGGECVPDIGENCDDVDPLVLPDKKSEDEGDGDGKNPKAAEQCSSSCSGVDGKLGILGSFACCLFES